MAKLSETYELREHVPNLSEKLAPTRIALLSESTRSVTYFDTFDWRLYRAGLSLVQTGTTAILQQIKSNECLGEQKIRRQLSGLFSWDFQDPHLRKELEKVMSIRALMARAKVNQKTQEYSVLNADEKTVVRLRHIQLKSENSEASSSTLTLQGVRGYENDFDKVKNSLFALNLVHKVNSSFEQIMKHAHNVPGDYSSKANIQLDQNLTGTEASRLIFQHLLNTIKQNEFGILSDIDTEFLHDFRVAIRRTRSALSQIKNVLPPDAVAHYKNQFRQLGKATNRLRDLDVYLLEENSYRNLLPADLQPGLDGMFQRFKKERKSAWRNFCQILKSSEYAALISVWHVFINGSHTYNDTLAVELAQKFIWKQFKRVHKKGRAIKPDTPDEVLHSLRIDCKKLRYLLEFFASLFPQNTMSDLIRWQKVLQDNLGDFNDLSVQQQALLDYLEKTLPRSQKEDRFLSAAAIGGLVARLHEQHQNVRREFHNSFEVFASKTNTQMYRDLFKP